MARINNVDYKFTDIPKGLLFLVKVGKKIGPPGQYIVPPKQVQGAPALLPRKSVQGPPIPQRRMSPVPPRPPKPAPIRLSPVPPRPSKPAPIRLSPVRPAPIRCAPIRPAPVRLSPVRHYLPTWPVAKVSEEYENLKNSIIQRQHRESLELEAEQQARLHMVTPPIRPPRKIDLRGSPPRLPSPRRGSPPKAKPRNNLLRRGSPPRLPSPIRRSSPKRVPIAKLGNHLQERQNQISVERPWRRNQRYQPAQPKYQPPPQPKYQPPPQPKFQPPPQPKYQTPPQKYLSFRKQKYQPPPRNPQRRSPPPHLISPPPSVRNSVDLYSPVVRRRQDSLPHLISPLPSIRNSVDLYSPVVRRRQDSLGGAPVNEKSSSSDALYGADDADDEVVDYEEDSNAEYDGYKS